MLPRNPLARIRVKAGFATAAAAAQTLNVSRVHLLNVERGRTGASTDLVSRMSTLYHSSPESIFKAIKASQIDLLKRTTQSLKHA